MLWNACCDEDAYNWAHWRRNRFFWPLNVISHVFTGLAGGWCFFLCSFQCQPLLHLLLSLSLSLSLSLYLSPCCLSVCLSLLFFHSISLIFFAPILYITLLFVLVLLFARHLITILKRGGARVVEGAKFEKKKKKMEGAHHMCSVFKFFFIGAMNGAWLSVMIS